MLGKLGARKVSAQKGTLSAINEPSISIDSNTFYAMDEEKLKELADTVGVSIANSSSIQHARNRLLNDAQIKR